MDFFHDDEFINTLSTDDRLEIFRYILVGNSDFTRELLEEVLKDYGVGRLAGRWVLGEN
ncbi:MAG TPA: hypothetical protein PKV59_09200 [Flexilinea sp.]|nr:hypothetical protein [Flexilinea sp.]